MTLRVTPWGKDNFKATSGEAEAKDWAYWQNRMNRASLVMLAEEGKINEAENELYMGMVEDDVDYLELALTFYLYLNDMDGDFLDDNDYSREEVLEGMKDLASDWGVTGLEAF